MSKTSGSSWERQLIESYIPHIPLVMFPPLFFLRVVKPVTLCPVHNETRLVVYSNKRKKNAMLFWCIQCPCGIPMYSENAMQCRHRFVVSETSR